MYVAAYLEKIMLDLNSLLTGEVNEISFEREYPLDGVSADILSGKCFAKGKCVNYSGYIEFTADLFLEYTALCARCGEEFGGKGEMNITYPVAVKLENADRDQDEYLVPENGKLDLQSICISSVILNLPIKFLCGEDCRGICPDCGKNLNQEKCLCNRIKGDPRLEKLKDYFNKQ
jgi:uncharacterized protein